jgi:hypothetical protein
MPSIRTFFSADKGKRIEVEEGKGYTLIVNGRTVAWPNYGRYVVLQIVFSWSPTSEAIFVNDDEGSGMNPVLHDCRVPAQPRCPTSTSLSPQHFGKT